MTPVNKIYEPVETWLFELREIPFKVELEQFQSQNFIKDLEVTRKRFSSSPFPRAV